MVLRTMRTAAHTSIKANSVPILVISPATPAGTNAANKPTATMKSTLLWAGVRKRGCILLKNGGNSPSWLMLRKMRLCANNVTMITLQ